MAVLLLLEVGENLCTVVGVLIYHICKITLFCFREGQAWVLQAVSWLHSHTCSYFLALELLTEKENYDVRYSV